MKASPRLPASPSRLKRLVRAMRGRRIGVLGDVMLDRYLVGSASRLSPEAAVPVVDFEKQEDFPGGAANVAANLAAFGARVSLFGVLGEDTAAAELRRCLAERELGDKGVLVDASRPTTVKQRIIAQHQQIVRVDRESRAPLDKEIEERLIRHVKSALANLDALIVSDYDKGVVTDAVAARILEVANQKGVRSFVKPKISLQFSYRGATAIVCNRKETEFFVSRALADAEAMEQAGRALVAHFGCAGAVITLGRQGMAVFDETHAKPLHIPATSFEVTYARVGQPGLTRGIAGRQVFDVTGAVDTVISVLALAASAGATLRDAAWLANLSAGVVVGKLGTATVSADELLAAIAEMP